MIDFREQLEERKSEIDSLLDSLENGDTLKKGFCTTTVKGAVFLLLYSLVESLVYLTFEALFDDISDKCEAFEKLTSNMKTQYKKYDEQLEHKGNAFTSIDFEKYLDKHKLFSGNLDARRIRSIMLDWGIESDFHCDGEEELLYVKKYRNELAHGARSFSEVGRNFTIAELRNKLAAVHFYMSKYAETMDIFISNKKYLDTVSIT